MPSSLSNLHKIIIDELFKDYDSWRITPDESSYLNSVYSDSLACGHIFCQPRNTNIPANIGVCCIYDDCVGLKIAPYQFLDNNDFTFYFHDPNFPSTVIQALNDICVEYNKWLIRKQEREKIWNTSS